MMKRILVLLAVAGVAILGAAAAAQAGAVRNTTVSYAYSGWVPCANGGAGELVNGTIEAHLLDTSTVNDNVDVSHFLFAPRGTLVGRTSGDSYRLGGVEHGSYVEGTANDHGVLTYINRYRLIGAGSAPNLVVRETAHVTRDGDDVVVQFDDYSIECG
jgi:hypothetical protein